MTKDQIEYMLNRFLGWKLPKTFNPDAGISYTPPHYGPDMNPEHIRPSGTNLFDAQQAKEMIEYLVEGMPATPPAAALAPVAKPYRYSAFENFTVREVSPTPSTPAPKNCQTGWADFCKASQHDGVACPADSCDIDDGVRKDHAPSTPAPAEMTDAQVDALIEPILRASGSSLRNYSMAKPKEGMRAAMRTALLSVSSQNATATQDSADLSAVYDVFHIGSQARSISTLLVNCQNADRRADCLSGIEQLFTYEVPDEDCPDELIDECDLNWGHDRAEYAEAFKAALPAFIARNPQYATPPTRPDVGEAREQILEDESDGSWAAFELSHHAQMSDKMDRWPVWLDAWHAALLAPQSSEKEDQVIAAKQQGDAS